jgi:transcriptional regulator with XRE-family HTH domain
VPSFVAELANDLDVHVRRRLRELRSERGLTLEAVASAAQIDVSTLSRLESGKRRLALDHVPALAAALGVTTDDLLTRRPREDPRVRGRPRTRNGLTMWPLTRHGPAGGLQAYKFRIGAERNEPPADLPTHEGHDWLYVLNGRMRLLLGDDDLVIEPGEAVEFSTWTPHWFGAVDGPVELIAILGPHGERVHTH